MKLVHKLVGYDRNTEFVGAEFNVPDQKFDLVRRIAGVNRQKDPDAMGNYRLSRPEAEEIAKIIGASIDTKQYDFFLEPEGA
jgi:hypothetical protein